MPRFPSAPQPANPRVTLPKMPKPPATKTFNVPGVRTTPRVPRGPVRAPKP